jgi:hypothetical protein
VQLNTLYSDAERAHDAMLCDELNIKIQTVTLALEKFIGMLELAASTCNWEVRHVII